MHVRLSINGIDLSGHLCRAHGNHERGQCNVLSQGFTRRSQFSLRESHGQIAVVERRHHYPLGALISRELQRKRTVHFTHSSAVFSLETQGSKGQGRPRSSVEHCSLPLHLLGKEQGGEQHRYE